MATELLERGNDAAEAGNFPEALRIFSDIIESEGTSDDQCGRAWECKAQVNLMMQNADEARRCAEKAMAILPHWGPARATYADVLLELGLNDKACEAYRGAISLSVPVKDIVCGLVEAVWHRVPTVESCHRADIGPASQVWPCGRLLGAYLLGNPLQSHDRVLELGCGASGIVGKCCLQSGVREVLFTDFQDVLDAMQGTSALTVRAFDWRNQGDCNALIADFRPTVVIGADLVYNEGVIEPLVARLAELAAAGTDILMCHQSRWPLVDEKLANEFSARGLVKDSIMVTQPQGRFARNCELFRLTQEEISQP